MISFRVKLFLFLIFIILVVIVTWIYAQRTYSAYNVVEPGGSAAPDAQNPGSGSVGLTVDPSSSQTITLMPTAVATIQGDVGCTLPLEFWVQNPTKIPPQILVDVIAGNQAEACVNYAQSDVCAVLGEVSISPEVILRQQFLVAIINYLSGADTGVIGNTINDAFEWLRLHLSIETIPEEDQQFALLYADTLRSYNEGAIGPGACEVEVVPVDQAETPIPSPTTSNATAAISPTITNTPTARRTVVITVPVATDTPDPGPEPTQPPPPTNTEQAPSDTPLPPPTNTEIPPATATEFPTPTPVPEDSTPTPVP
jgi:hypothetical protein